MEDATKKKLKAVGKTALGAAEVAWGGAKWVVLKGGPSIAIAAVTAIDKNTGRTLEREYRQLQKHGVYAQGVREYTEDSFTHGIGQIREGISDFQKSNQADLPKTNASYVAPSKKQEKSQKESNFSNYYNVTLDGYGAEHLELSTKKIVLVDRNIVLPFDNVQKVDRSGGKLIIYTKWSQYTVIFANLIEAEKVEGKIRRAIN